MVSLATPVYVSVRAITNKFGDDVTRGFRGANRQVQRNGEDLGRAFTTGFNRGVDVNAFRRVSNGLNSMVPGAVQAQKAFTSLIRYSYTLSTALVGVVGGVSSVISSLGALAGAAGGAISTVSVLGNAIAALGLGMASVKLATGGVGGALKKLQQQTASAGATSTRTALQTVRDNQAREQAARRVEDAERSLMRVIEGNRDRLISANADVADAQRDLNDAIRDGREELQQLGFDAEDAALNEQKAAIDLEKARETLARVQDLPPNSRARREAELAYAEAELNYRKSKDANSDLAKEQDRLAKSGVNGLQSVIDARNKLADAEVDRAKTVKDNLEDEADAQRNLNEAKQDAANVDDRQDAAGGGGGGVAAATAAGNAWDDGLNDAQRKFVLFLNGLRPQMEALSEIAANAFLPRLTTAITLLMNGAYPVIATGIEKVATAMGNAAIIFAQFVTTEDNLRRLGNLFDTSAPLIETFGNIAGRAFGVILSILERTAPIAQRFFDFIDEKLGNFDDFLNTAEGNFALGDFFARAEYSAKQFGDVFGNIFGGIGAIISANIGPGTGGALLLDYFEKATSDWGNSTGLQDFFLAVAENATHVMDTIGNLTSALGDLGANENIGKAFEILNKPENVKALNDILQMTADAAPKLAELTGVIGQIIAALTDTGAMQVFFETLMNILTPILDFVSDPANKEFMDFWGRVFAMFSAVGLILGGVGTGLKVFTGIIIAILKPFAVLSGALKIFTALKAGAMAASYGMAGATYAVGAAQKIAYAATVLFNGSLFKAIGLKIKDIAQTAILTGMYAKDAAVKGLATIKQLALNGAQLAWNGIQAAGKGIMIAGAAAWRVLNAAMAANPIGLIITAITLLVGALVWFFTQTEVGKVIWAEFTRFLSEAWANIVRFFEDSVANVTRFFSEAWTNISRFATEAWTNISNFFSGLWDGIVDVFQGAVDWLVDLFLNWTIYGLIIQNWDAIVVFFEEAWANIMGFFDAAFKWIDQYIIQPFVLLIQYLAYGFEQNFNFIKDVWNNLMKALDTVWQWINRYIFTPIQKAVDLIRLAFAYAGTMIAKTWDDMMKALDIVWQWIDNNIFGPIKTAVGLVQQAFENVADGIAKAWDGIKKAAAIPINFVIDTVYNNGLRSFWNDIADNLNMKDLKLPKAKTVAFAGGGVMPGYSPGKDIHKFYSPTGGFLHLSGGEAIMRPEWTRMMGGPAAVARMNKAAIRGQAFATGGVYQGVRSQSFAKGGTTSFAGDFLDGLGNIMEIIGDFFVNPGNAVQKHLVDGLIKPLLNNGDDSMFGKLVGGVPVRIAENIGTAFKSFFGGAEGVQGQTGMGWQAMWAMVKQAIPGAVKTSDYRPGSVTVNGGKSYHGSGRAIDVVPASMDTFNRMLALFPNARELIYTPAGNRQLLNGKPFGNWSAGVKAQHYNHVHAAMANGGTVYPSAGGTIVQVAEAGRAERIEPLDQNGLSDRDKAMIKMLAGDGRSIIINVTQLPGENGEDLAQKVSRIISREMRMGSEV